jgi:hypothetical protein
LGDDQGVDGTKDSVILSSYESKAGGQVFYVLEYYSPDSSGEKRKLRSDTHHGPSMNHAISYARAVLKYVIIQDRKPDLCLIKDPGGKVLTVVAGVSLSRNEPSRNETSPAILDA